MNHSGKEVVCHLTSVHQSNDVRIFHKECASLAAAGYQVYLIAANAENRTEKGVHIMGVHSTSRSRIGRMIKTVNAIDSLAIELNADIYHLHDPELLRIAGKLKKAGKKVIYDAHEDLPRQIMSKPWISRYVRAIVSRIVEKYENSKVKKLDMIVAATPFIKERFQGLNPRCININNYPILSEIAVETVHEKSRNALCYIGGISRIRGISELMAALSLTKEDVVLHMAGPFESAAFEQELRTLPAWDKVKYHGVLDRKGVCDIMSQCVAGIVTFLPYPNHINAQPNKMFEYMSASLAVIASHFPLWDEIINGVQCGLCVDPRSPHSISDAMDKLVRDEQLTNNFRKNGKRAVHNTYNWNKEKAKLIESYNAIIN